MLSIVTSNHKKFEQISMHLPDTIRKEQVSLDIEEIQANDLTHISADKCKKAYQQVQWPVVVDDTGIYFDAFDTFPWAMTKFLYTGVWLKGIRNLFTGVENTQARFHTVLSYMDSTMSSPHQCIGEVAGHLVFDHIHELWSEHAKIPFDMIFVPSWSSQAAFQIPKQWYQDNHRVRAAKKLATFLEAF